MRLWILAAVACAGCRTPTEIALELDTPSGAPPVIRVKLARSTPFSENPTNTPPYVQAEIDGADLDLDVTPQGMKTQLSLLPNPNGPLDLTITVSAAGYAVDPPSNDTGFAANVSTQVHFTLTPIPSGDMATPHDMARPKDAGVVDQKPGD